MELLGCVLEPRSPKISDHHSSQQLLNGAKIAPFGGGALKSGKVFINLNKEPKTPKKGSSAMRARALGLQSLALSSAGCAALALAWLRRRKQQKTLDLRV